MFTVLEEKVKKKRVLACAKLTAKMLECVDGHQDMAVAECL